MEIGEFPVKQANHGGLMEIKISAQEIQNTINTARTGATPEAVEAFKKLGMLKCKQAGPALIARITDKDPEIRLVCTQESVDILGKAALKYLVACLEDKVIQIGMTAAAQLACLGTRKAAEALIQAAGSTDLIIQTHGTYGLDFWDSKEGAGVLRKAVLDQDSEYRGTVAIALGQIGGKKVPPELARAFNRATDEAEKMQIAAALTMLGDDRREVIREGLRSQWVPVKFAALTCVKAIKDKGAFLDIVPLLKDVDEGISREASDTLEAIGLTQKEKRFLSKNDQAKYAIKRALPEGYQMDADE